MLIRSQPPIDFGCHAVVAMSDAFGYCQNIDRGVSCVGGEMSQGSHHS